MSNLREAPTRLHLERPWYSHSDNGTVAEYLDDFCLPLYEVMPEQDVRQYRSLAEEHLQDLMEEFRAEGFSVHGAMHAALREHGNPRLIGRLLSEEWRREGKTSAESHAVRTTAKYIALCSGVVYLCLACAIWLLISNTVISTLTFLVSPILAGIIAGSVAFFPVRRSNLWVVATTCYLFFLTTLLLTLRQDTPTAILLMSLWSIAAGIVTRETRVYWQHRLQREIYRRYLC